MRLLNVHTKQLYTFYGDSTPEYAILSHTWLEDHEEVTFPHLQSQQPSTWSHLPGAKKVDYTCQQAEHDGYEWAWIDTCCIDKTNNAELSEAINSMFQWYQKAQVCYVFLLDVDPKKEGDMFTSRWWSRAWTLQELVAPANVQFFNGDWRNVGSKSDLANEIALKKSIDSDTLRDSAITFSRSIAQRMSWAAQRQATREEDLAYALLGIFDINMTMQYGEGGEKAFVRLQKEIMRTRKDLSIFAWGFKALPLESLFSGSIDLGSQERPDLSYLDSYQSPGDASRDGLLASQPSDFAGTHEIVCLSEQDKDVGDVETEEERYGVQTLTTLVIASPEIEGRPDLSNRWLLALLPCVLRNNPYFLIGIYFRRSLAARGRNVKRHAFVGQSFTCLIRSEHIITASLQTLKIDTRRLLRGDNTSMYSDKFIRTLVIRPQRNIHCNVPNLSFDILKPSRWENDQSDPNRFITRGEPSGFFTIIRLYDEGAHSAVYLGFKNDPVTKRDLDQDPSNSFCCTMTALPPDHPNHEVLAALLFLFQDYPKSIKSKVSGMKERMFKGDIECFGGDFCPHVRLYINVKTTFAFNQALTTVALVLCGSNRGWSRPWGLLQEAGMYGSHSMCIDI